MQTTYMCCTVSVSTSFITVLLTQLHSSQGARPGELYIVAAALHSSVFLSCGFRLHRSSHQQWMDALRWSLMHRNTENATERQSCIHRGLSVTFSVCVREDRLHRSASIHRCELGVRIVKGCHCTRIIALHYIYTTRIVTLDCIYYIRIVTTG